MVCLFLINCSGFGLDCVLACVPLCPSLLETVSYQLNINNNIITSDSVYINFL